MLNLVLAGIVGILVLSNLTLKVKNENAAPKSKKVQKSSSVKNNMDINMENINEVLLSNDKKLEILSAIKKVYILHYK